MIQLYTSKLSNQSKRCLYKRTRNGISIAKWSIETKLVFNTGKAKFILLTTKQSRYGIKICYNGIKGERVSAWELLGDH